MCSTIKQPWLSQGIEKQIRQALDSVSGVSSSSHLRDKLYYENDRSTVRIPSSLPEQWAQLIEFRAYDEPIEGILSDKTTTIRSKFDPTATKIFRYNQGRRLTEGTRGSLIKIYKFDIIVTQFDSTQPQVALLISQFILHGVGGNGVWGRPRPFELSNQLKETLSELRKPLSKGFQLSQVLSDKTQSSVDCNHLRRSSFDEVEPRNTQAAFATQVPLGMLVKDPTKADVGLSSPSDPISVPCLLSDDGTPADVLSQQESDGDKSTRTSASPRARRQLKGNDVLHHPDTSNQQLIRLSKTKGEDKLHKLLCGKSKSNKNGTPVVRSTLQSMYPIASATANNQKDSLSIIETEPNGPPKVVSVLDNSRSKVDESTRTRTTLIQKPPSSAYPLGTQEIIEEPQKSILKVIADTDALSAAIPCVSSSDIRDTTLFEAPIPAQSIMQATDSQKIEIRVDDKNVSILGIKEDPWAGMSRIPRRVTRIPKAQQDLLDRSDCWVPPQPGTRAPTANIPLAILHAFTSQIDDDEASLRHNQALNGKQKTDYGSSQSSAISQCHSESESSDDSDELISSEDWPPSSPIKIHQTSRLPSDSPVGQPEFGHSRQILDSANSSVNVSIPPDQQYSLPKSRKLVPLSESPTRHVLPGMISSSPVHSSNGYHHPFLEQRRDLGIAFSDIHNGTRGLKCSFCNLPTKLKSSKGSKRDESDLSSLYTCATCGKPYETQDEFMNRGQIQSYANRESIDHELVPTSNNLIASEVPLEEEHLLESPEMTYEHHVLKPLLTMNMQDERDIYNETEKDNALTSSSLRRDQIPLAAHSFSQPSSMTKTEMKSSYPTWITESEPHMSCTTDFGEREKPVLQVNRTPYPPGQMINPRLIMDKLNDTEKRSPISSRDCLFSDDVIKGTYSDRTMSPESISERKGMDPRQLTQIKQIDERNEYREPLLQVNADSPKSASLRSRDVHSLPSSPLSLKPDDERGKRKVQYTDTDQSTQYIQKRRRCHQGPKEFESSQESQILKGLEISPRQHRQESLAYHSYVSPCHQDQVENFKKQLQPESDQNAHVSCDLSEVILETDTKGLKVALSQYEVGVLANQVESAKSTAEPRDADFKILIPTGEGETRTRLNVSELSENEVVSNKEVYANVTPPRKSPKVVSSLSNLALLYERFRRAYGAYTGNEKHFRTMCRRIVSLLIDSRMEHPSLWDDFIIRHNIEYRQHLHQCTDEGDDPLPYERFYRDRIDEPIYTKRVITPAVLREFVASLSPATKDSIRESGSKPPLNLKPGHRLKSSLPSVRKSPTTQTTSAPIVDLTKNNKALSLHASTFPKKSPRRISWAESHSTPSKPSSKSITKRHKSSLTGNLTPLNTLTKSRIIHKAPVSNSQSKSADLDAHTSVTSGPDKTFPGFTCSPRNTTNHQLQKIGTANVSIAHAHPSEWYLDDSNPFRTYARVDASLRAGNGNSWSATKEVNVSLNTAEKDVDIRDETEGVIRVRKQKVNIMKWEI